MEGLVIVVLLVVMAGGVVVRLRLERHEDQLGLWLLRRGFLGASLVVLGAAAWFGLWVTRGDVPVAAWITIALVILSGAAVAVRERRSTRGSVAAMRSTRPTESPRRAPSQLDYGPHGRLVEAFLRVLGTRTTTEWLAQANHLVQERSVLDRIAMERAESELRTAARPGERAVAASAARQVVESLLPDPLIEADKGESELARALVLDASTQAAEALVVVDLLSESQRRWFLGPFLTVLPPLPPARVREG